VVLFAVAFCSAEVGADEDVSGLDEDTAERIVAAGFAKEPDSGAWVGSDDANGDGRVLTEGGNHRGLLSA